MRPADPIVAILDEVYGVAAADDEALVIQRGELVAIVRRHAPLLATVQVDELADRVQARLSGLGAIEPFLADPAVTDIMVNGAGPVYVERDGRIVGTDVTVAADEAALLIERIVAPLGLRVDRVSPLVDARLADGSRVNAVVPPLAVDGPYLTIRRFRAEPFSLHAFAPRAVVGLLEWLVASRANMVVSGATGAGKTSLLNALASCIASGERVITVEDAAELRLPGGHVVRLEARPPNAEGIGGVGVRSLVRNALRMRPDRIIVGEVRGPEALDMVQAMNTGHDGSLSTCHANSPRDALRRLETMVLMDDVALSLAAVRDHLAAAIDVVVQIARQADGARRVVAVAEVVDGDVRPLADGEGLIARPVRRPRSLVAAAAPGPEA